ncbi:MAG: transglutaminase family protein [Candidatus Dormibacteraeota bacterium]|nr:transglutaminase family protein [Candidatus Dormibacteraeota bacterium]
MKRFEIEHTTRFTYSGPITETMMELRLTPLSNPRQRLLDFKLEINPRVNVSTYKDGYGNFVHYFNLLRAHRKVRVTSRSLVEMNGERATADPEDDLVGDFLRFRSPVTDEPGVRALAERHRPADLASGPAVETALEKLTVAISRDFNYDPAVTTVYTEVAEVLQLRAGVCQDFAHLFIAAARAMEVPARYVSGYIHVPGAGGVMEGASHAWAEAWVPGAGWVGFDATHPVRAGENHVRVAVGRDYRDAAPTRGVYVGMATGAMSVNVRTRGIEAEA